MMTWRRSLLVLLGVVLAAIIGAALLIGRGFRATSEPSRLERVMARSIRNLAIPHASRHEKDPLKASAENLQAGRELFLARCANCHGIDGSGVTPMGGSLYPRVPDLRSPETQSLSDGEIHYIIKNGVQLTGMPACGNAYPDAGDIWRLNT